jgi:hypothetical protein
VLLGARLSPAAVKGAVEYRAEASVGALMARLCGRPVPANACPRASRVEGIVSRSRILVANETFCRGWVAIVDGASAPIFRANGLVRAVPIPAGSQDVEMRFAPRALSIGRSVSVASASLGLTILGWAAFRKGRR